MCTGSGVYFIAQDLRALTSTTQPLSDSRKEARYEQLETSSKTVHVPAGTRVGGSTSSSLCQLCRVGLLARLDWAAAARKDRGPMDHVGASLLRLPRSRTEEEVVSETKNISPSCHAWEHAVVLCVGGWGANVWRLTGRIIEQM